MARLVVGTDLLIMTIFDHLENLKKWKRWDIIRGFEIFALSWFHSNGFKSTWVERYNALAGRDEDISC